MRQHVKSIFSVVMPHSGGATTAEWHRLDVEGNVGLVHCPAAEGELVTNRSIVSWLRLKTYPASGRGVRLISSKASSNDEYRRTGSMGPNTSSFMTWSLQDTGYTMVGSRYRASGSPVPPWTTTAGSMRPNKRSTSWELTIRE